MKKENYFMECYSSHEIGSSSRREDKPKARDFTRPSETVRARPYSTITDRIHPPEWLEMMHKDVALQTWKNFYIERNKKDKNFQEYLAKLDNKAQSLVYNTKPWMRVSPEALEKILVSGRIKSYFETGTSYGHIEDEEDVTMRKDAEYGLFSYEMNLDSQMRPLYGYITDRPDGSVAQDRMRQYGSIAICFKEHVKDRTTVTIDDSLAQTDGKNYLNVKPTPYNWPTKDMFLVGPGQRDPLTYQNIHDVRRYPEAQFHGGLQISDIEKVIFRYSTYPNLSLITSLNRNNISYEILEY